MQNRYHTLEKKVDPGRDKMGSRSSRRGDRDLSWRMFHGEGGVFCIWMECPEDINEIISSKYHLRLVFTYEFSILMIGPLV